MRAPRSCRRYKLTLAALANNVFINHSVMMSAAGGIEIEEGVQIAPRVNLITVNHDLKDKMIVICKPVHIKKNAWIGAAATILPGVTIGENAVVGAARQCRD